MIPFARMDWANSSNRSAWNNRRGWSGLGSINSTGMSMVFGSEGEGGGVGRGGNREPSPLPSALRGFSILFMRQNLFCKLNITLRAARTGIIAQDWLPETGSFRETDAARDYCSKHLITEKSTEIGGDLAG